MKRFFTKDIETFLRAVDGHLTGRFPVIVIGGAAAALAYRTGRS